MIEDTEPGELIPGEGETRTRTEVCRRRECDLHGCDYLATHRMSYLLRNARRNSLSSAYGRDDVSWCSDGDAYSCDAHKSIFESNSVKAGLEWCSTFGIKAFPHMFLHWVLK